MGIADRGPGLPPDALGRLFEPFFSTRGSTGLGLAVCHRIAGDHGGDVRGDNRPGGGAVFAVRLPLAAGEALAPAAAGAATYDGATTAATARDAAAVAVEGRAG